MKIGEPIILGNRILFGGLVGVSEYQVSEFQGIYSGNDLTHRVLQNEQKTVSLLSDTRENARRTVVINNLTDSQAREPTVWEHRRPDTISVGLTVIHDHLSHSAKLIKVVEPIGTFLISFSEMKETINRIIQRYSIVGHCIDENNLVGGNHASGNFVLLAFKVNVIVHFKERYGLSFSVDCPLALTAFICSVSFQPQ